MKLNTPITIRQLIAIVRSKADQELSYCVYGRGDSREVSLDSTCYIGRHPEITDDFAELFPPFVNENRLEFWCRDELVQDVIANATHQDASVSDETVLKAIKHYDKHDSFLDLNS